MPFTSRIRRFNTTTTLFAVACVPLIAAACSGDNNDVTTPVAPTITVTAGASQTGVVNAALAVPISVRLTDAAGNPMSNVVVGFTVGTNAGSVSTPEPTTDANGVATVTWTLGTVAGVDTLTVGMNDVSTTIVATATADVASQFLVVSGNQQSGTVGTALAAPLVAKITDKYGNAVSGAQVQWTNDSGGTFGSTTTTTSVTGLTQTTYTLGTNPGAENVTATVTVNGQPLTASFVATGS